MDPKSWALNWKPLVSNTVGPSEVSDGGPVEAVEDPFEGMAVFAVAKPHEVALFVTAEPVDEEDLRKFA